MLTQVKTPQEIFFLPQRLLVPLFQRPYVWAQEAQWEPLWEDVTRVAERHLAGDPQAKHFLGAVVLQQQLNEVGTLTSRTIIDGQQRLTTLQLLLDAVHDCLINRDMAELTHQLADLTSNQLHHRQEPEDQFKVWPTNRDREAFAEVMSTVVEDHDHLQHPRSRMAQAHRYFVESCREWLDQDTTVVLVRAQALVQALVMRLQLVVIDLQADEDAQEIFETLNARGTPLSAADLIKNFVFQRLDLPAAQQEKAYHELWEQFETPFWEKEVSSGRVTYTRSSLFLSQWLTSRTKQDITGREVFSAFKRHIVDGDIPMQQTLEQIRDLAAIYRELTIAAADKHQPLDRTALFLYRANTMQSEVVKPFLLWLVDPSLPPVPDDQRDKALAALESWLVRRTLVRATSKGYNKFVVDLLQTIGGRSRSDVGDQVEKLLAGQTSPTRYWPGDEEVRRELGEASIYLTLSRARLRMILEAIEDHRRGFDAPKPKHEQRVVRGSCTVEHVLPQQWRAHWPVSDPELENARDAVVHRLGNLTLATQSLNTSASHAAWLGPKGKQKAFQKHTSLLLTTDVLERAGEEWTEPKIEQRTTAMTDDILEIWPVPAGHTGLVTGARERLANRVGVSDLIASGMLTVGQELYARPKSHRGSTCQVAADGRLFVNGEPYLTLSAAARAVTKSQSEAGWWFWLIDPDMDVSVSDLRRDYLDAQGLQEVELPDDSESGDQPG